MHFRTPADRGSVTAEFAAVVPAVVLVLAFALGALQLAGEQLRLQSAVSDAARSAGRGDPLDGPIEQVSTQAIVRADDRANLVCVQATAPANLGILVGITLSATSCALADGQ
jgi:Flp pilus assembly protein TadG